MKFKPCVFCLISICLLIGGCGTPKNALQMSPTTLADRQMQTRLFETKDEASVLSASAAVLQDLGFNLDESETKLGVIVASKERDATNAGQVATAIFVAAFTGVASPVDKQQKLRVSLVTHSAGDTKDKIAVRVTFQRIVWDNYGKVTKLEKLTDDKMYQGFFEKLSKSIFLEAQSI